MSQDFHHSIKAIKGLKCSSHLDLLRGMDALLVVIVHLSDMFFALSFANPSLIGKAAMFFVVQGISSVLTFFVLSGYLISMSIFDPLRKGTFSWRAYLVNRLSRLYVVLIPALLLGALWDWLGMRLYGLNSPYGGVTLGSITVPPSVVSYFTWENFLGQLLFLQEIKCHTFGSNGVLWSLSSEFWYYLIFPALLMAFYKPSDKTRTAGSRLLCLAVGVAGLCFIGSLKIWHFLLWLMGTALIFLPLVPQWKGTAKGRVFCVTMGLACFILRLNLTPAMPGPQLRIPLEFLLGLSCMVCMYFVLHDKAPVSPDKDKFYSYEYGSDLLASFSYSLYLVHMPFMLFLRATLIKSERWPLDFQHLCYGFLVLLVIMSYAWMVAQLTEKQTPKVRKLFMKLTSGLDKEKNKSQAAQAAQAAQIESGRELDP